ncbi:hypothetical protein TCAL_00852 [Tigriopus californicus]|uniref:Semaphorin-2A n=1 Tax=Tigriopus californicus TaxID=6832 RepID=A0A553NBN5_TIGCA|nr:semaphorin-2A-like [Tigriopus californicus]TRY62769.1 hypothetical protein TCAL_00852 [Tigriopus californicus]|eukprot:TCALIF_00852-PA protein Name:"Similar to SEMA-2A Semaphorin-2A (Schistocerca gregaria)" AED:0.01 eAED:0.01 QI:0/-1/0/1/-1/1/1/0/698
MDTQIILALCLGITLATPIEQPYLQELSCGQYFYRTLFMDERNDALFVGGMDRVYKLNAANITHSDCDKDMVYIPSSSTVNCISKGKSADFDCKNHIRVIQPIADGSRLYVCGTNAHQPKDHVLYANLTHLARHEFYPGVGDGIAKCPFDPEDNSTALWVEEGNPGGHPAVYSGTNAEFTKADSVIFRGDIFDISTGRREYTFKRTIKYDSHMLDKPDFVGSYEIGQHVFFFFRETSVEFLNCGKTVYSRVARVCKNDVGGKNILNQNWATYLKARLNCSLSGEVPFFFNEIQDIYKSPEDDSIFHAVFATGSNGLSGSAICSFTLDDLQKTFDEGKFKEQATTTSIWLPVPSTRVPTPRPGTCVDDTRNLSDTVLNFIRKHPLMDTIAPHDQKEPVFYTSDAIFTKIVVDSVNAGSYGKDRPFHVYYAGTLDGRVFKISRWTNEQGVYETRLLDVFEVTTPYRVEAMTLSRKVKAIYVTSDHSIKQLSVEVCASRYTSCVQCVRDPYCGWDRESGLCRPKHFSLLQDPAGEAPGICDMSNPKQKVSANFGGSVHLECALNLPSSKDNLASIAWHHLDARGRRTKINFKLSRDKFIMTQTFGLVVLGVNERDNGEYQCHYHSEIVSHYEVAVDAHRCSSPNKTADYQKVYSEWCSEFQKYKSALKTWEKRQNNKCLPKEAFLKSQNSVYRTDSTNPYV